MFSHLSQRLSTTINQLRGTGRLTEKNMDDTLRDIRRALLEADVALEVTGCFIENIKQKALGQKVLASIRPGDALVKMVSDELTATLGGASAELNLKAEPPVVLLMAGLQGSGKTTTAAKIARWLTQTQKKKVMLVSTDVYRPAAMDQLHTLAQSIGVPFFPSNPSQKPQDIVTAALRESKIQFMDVLIIDTAGRLHIDEPLMEELQTLSRLAKPTETLLVVDSMAGQDAVNTAKIFHDRISLTGIVLTKTDGDARGGAALSMRMITQCPIKFIGTGEKIEGLEVFHPDRIASRILGMGDIVSLVEEAEQKINRKTAEKLTQKLKKGQRFDFNDFLDQLQQMNQMGGLKSLLSKMPNLPQLPKGTASMMDDSLLKKMQAIIQSMTAKERKFPALINNSRKQRIAKGSGTQMQDVNKLLKQFTHMQKMMKRMQGNKMAKQLKQLQQLQSQLPPDLLSKLPKGLL